VVYAVPGSPLVAESTVMLLRERRDVDLHIEPATTLYECAAQLAHLGVLDG